MISSIHDFSREPEEIQGKTKGILHLVPCKVDFMEKMMFKLKKSLQGESEKLTLKMPEQAFSGSDKEDL